MTHIKTLKSVEIYRNKWLRLREDAILRESGKEGIFAVLEKEDFVVVIPVEKDSIYLVEQYRYAVSELTIELPQGAWESRPGTDPLQVARAELQEETGLVAASMVHVGYQLLACGYSTQGYHIFLATGLTQGPTQLDDEELGLTCKKVKVSTFETWIREGRIKDATSTTAYLLAKLKGYIPADKALGATAPSA